MKKDEIKRATGRREEDRVFEAISRLPGVKIYRNLYVPCGRGGRTSELDLVLLCSKGVWVTEVKSHSGQITGSLTRWEWSCAVKPPGAKSKRVTKFLNPLRQVKGQMAALSRYLGVPAAHMCGLVVFSDRATLRKVPSRADNCVVLQTRFVASCLKRYLAGRESCFSPAELCRLECRLDALVASGGIKRLHTIQARQAERARKNEQERRRTARQKPRGSSKNSQAVGPLLD